jgi:hypothetical protein
MPDKSAAGIHFPDFKQSRPICNLAHDPCCIGSPKSSIRLDEIMNNGKILWPTFLKAAWAKTMPPFMGRLLITKLQLAAMHRVDFPEEARRDFYLYVDEFQTFATVVL